MEPSLFRPLLVPAAFGTALLVLALCPAGSAVPETAPAAVVPPIVLEDFEAPALGARPFLWKQQIAQGATATIGAERAETGGSDGNKALKFEYTFAAAYDQAQAVEAGPLGQAIPGGVTALTMLVHGDAGKNAVGLRLKDRFGETFEWRLPVTWSGWQQKSFALDPRTAARQGVRANGVADLPLTFEAVRIVRTPAGGRTGEVMVDSISAECRFANVLSLYNTAEGVRPESWKANRNRSRIGLVADNILPRNGRDVSVLKMEYEYENGTDASVEFVRTVPAGDGHGTLIADIFGDGSNNVLRFRMLDDDGRVWQATWASVLVDWSGWKTLYVDTRTLRDPDATDPTSMISKFPVKFQSIIIDDCSPSDRLPGVESGRKGEIFLARLLFGQEK